VFCGSAPLTAAIWRAVAEWTGAPVSNVYGLTETASWVTGTTAGAGPEDGLVGRPWGSAVAVSADSDGPVNGSTPVSPPLTEGPVWVRTPSLMRGYLGRPDLTHAAVRAGWLATGDVGHLDMEGRLYLRGRQREEINRGGGKVHPEDVEAVVEQFDATLDSCAFGYEDDLGQEEVAMAVVLRAGDDEVLRRLYAWVRARLAAFQMPPLVRGGRDPANVSGQGEPPPGRGALRRPPAGGSADTGIRRAWRSEQSLSPWVARRCWLSSVVSS
jgi:acyl-CoA synthetase (AMP-forming)/AMP-acid ligase II